MEKTADSETVINTKTIQSKIQLEDEDEDKTPDGDESLQSSSVLLTPEASPVKDKDTVSEPAACSDDNGVETSNAGSRSPLGVDHTYAQIEPKLCLSDSESTSHCKQLREGTESPLSTSSSQSSVPKKRKGKRGKVKPTSVDDKSFTPPRPRPGRRKKTEPPTQNKTITDYFPVRRSGRRCLSSLKKEQTEEVEKKILSHCEEGLKVVNFEGKGRGVMATRSFFKGEFVVEYAGDLINIGEAKEKEKYYSGNPKVGCYMYYFIHKNKHFCVDATAESGKLGRLINHSRNGNCQPKVIEIKKLPYLTLVASREISEGEELLYDYGDRSKSSVESHPWLKL
ncbi:N-lysine methyltransferase KMT5A-like [Haliotis rufescens]|uniref:N-lysine methyltransferase KMT5A-like n=1 Tax=Haliotis rufescens TaxID=6454 RepID=UPI00201EE94D|nr:N-lysine methyltransferase KMT5A-like [Haliotis rufescens]XP_046353692.2 N-lysine methyltransferase KMT5A-like [Haliotis rufescens]